MEIAQKSGMFHPRRMILLLGTVATVLSCVYVPWRIRIKQKGDDMNLFWGYANLFTESRLAWGQMRVDAGNLTGAEYSPTEIEPMLDTNRVHLQLHAIMLVTLFLWLYFSPNKSAGWEALVGTNEQEGGKSQSTPQDSPAEPGNTAAV